jgi:hypothetical protein
MVLLLTAGSVTLLQQHDVIIACLLFDDWLALAQ